MVKRFEVYLVNMDERPARDAINTRPAVIISPDEMNDNLGYVIIAPIATTGVHYPTRVPISFLGEERQVVLDQLRTMDKDRLVKKIGAIDTTSQKAVVTGLLELFSE